MYEFETIVPIGKTLTLTSSISSLFHLSSGNDFYHVTMKYSITPDLTQFTQQKLSRPIVQGGSYMPRYRKIHALNFKNKTITNQGYGNTPFHEPEVISLNNIHMNLAGP